MPPCALPILLWGLETMKKAWTLESNHLGSNPSCHAYRRILEKIEKISLLFSTTKCWRVDIIHLLRSPVLGVCQDDALSGFRGFVSPSFFGLAWCWDHLCNNNLFYGLDDGPSYPACIQQTCTYSLMNYTWDRAVLKRGYKHLNILLYILLMLVASDTGCFRASSPFSDWIVL